mgnify:CR=1 FL=1
MLSEAVDPEAVAADAAVEEAFEDALDAVAAEVEAEVPPHPASIAAAVAPASKTLRNLFFIFLLLFYILILKMTAFVCILVKSGALCSGGLLLYAGSF